MYHSYHLVFREPSRPRHCLVKFSQQVALLISFTSCYTATFYNRLLKPGLTPIVEVQRIHNTVILLGTRQANAFLFILIVNNFFTRIILSRQLLDLLYPNNQIQLRTNLSLILSSVSYHSPVKTKRIRNTHLLSFCKASKITHL